MFYNRIEVRSKLKFEKQNFTEFLFLSKKQKLNLTFLRLLNLYVFGISLKRFIFIFSAKIGCGLSVPLFRIKEKNMLNLQQLIRKSILNIELKNVIKKNKKKKRFLKLYVAIRQLQHLPSRGQRTKTNAQTSKKLR